MVARVLLGLVVGLAVGAGFFGGLWWTLRRVERSRRPGTLLLLSLLVRLAVAGAGLTWAVRAGAPELLACLAGILLVREILKRTVGRVPGGPTGTELES